MLGGPLGRRHDRGSTSTLGLAIAAVIFATAFVVAEMIVAHPTNVDGKRAQFDAEAATGLDLLVGSAGQTAAGGAWAQDPDHLARFGLALPGATNFLDYAKIRALRNGSMSASANGHPDYPEVLAAMGFRSGDVHLRTYPVMPAFDDPRFVKEQRGRIAYVGHYGGASAAVNVTAASATLAGNALNASVTLRNEAPFEAIFTVDLNLGVPGDDDGVLSTQRHTTLLAPGASQTVWATFDRLPSWSADARAVNVDVTDAFGNAAVDAAGNRVGPIVLAQAPPVGGSNAYDLLISSSQVYVVAGGGAAFSLDHATGAGSRVNNAQARFVLVGPNGKEWQNTTLALERNKATQVACANCTMVGNYTGIVWDTAMTRRSQDVLHVSAAPMFTAKSTLDPVAGKEIQLLQSLVASFNPTRYDAASNPEGDVFGDDVNGASDIVSVMGRYTTIVVGSQISQNCLTPSAVKNGLADWVQAGGNLVVLGTVDRKSEWLQPIYHAAQTTANGGISAPDPTHPILVAPEHLNYQKYADRGRAWEIKNDEPFTHVLTRGQSGTSTEDTLAVANPGAFNNGTVVLTSYMPGSLMTPQDDVEATRLLHNLLSQAYTMLYLDYGPPIPEGVSVGSDARLVAVPHPNVPGAVVEVKLVLYRFG